MEFKNVKVINKTLKEEHFGTLELNKEWCLSIKNIPSGFKVVTDSIKEHPEDVMLRIGESALKIAFGINRHIKINDSLKRDMQQQRASQSTITLELKMGFVKRATLSGSELVLQYENGNVYELYFQKKRHAKKLFQVIKDILDGKDPYIA